MVLIDAKCVLQQPPDCPANTKLEGHKCITYVMPSCDKAAKWDGSRCVVSGRADCEEGIIRVTTASRVASHNAKTEPLMMGAGGDTLNIFPSWNLVLDGHWGTVLERHSPSSLRTDPEGQLGTVFDTHLAPWWSFTKNRCESIETPQCPKTFSWKGDKCVRIVEEYCELGYILKDGQCISGAIPNCGNLIFNGKACVDGHPHCSFTCNLLHY